MFERILTAYDDSEPARAAVELAARIASGMGARLDIVSVVGSQDYDEALEFPAPDLSEDTRQECERWSAKLEEAVELARQAARPSETLEVRQRILIGKAGDRLLDVISEDSVDLTVAGTHGVGHVKQKVFGSMSQRLLEKADCELLFVREKLPADEPPSIIAGCDGSEWSQRAVARAEQLARALGGPLVLTYVAGYPAPFADSAFLGGKARDSMREDLHAYGEKVIAEMRKLVSPDFENVVEDVREGHVRGEMLEATEQRAPAIAVVGTRGASGFSGLLVGSVTRDLLDYSKAPVMVVRHPDRGKSD